jgi:putative ABC transport system permease protein
MSLGRIRWRRLVRGLTLSFQLLFAHRLRSVLSMSGLVIGIAAVIVMVAIGKGAEQRLIAQMQAMGTDLLVVSATPAPRIAGRERQVPINTMLRAEDAAAIVAATPLAVAAAPVVTGPVVLRAEGLNRAALLTGITPQGLALRNIHAATGRLYTPHEEDAMERVMVLGPTVARSLFPGVNPVGRSVLLDNMPFEIVGVAQARGQDTTGGDLDDFLAVPFRTAARRVLNIPYVHNLFVQARNTADLDALEREIAAILQARHRPRIGMNEPFAIQNQVALVASERGTADAMNRLVLVVGAIALLLGAVGIVTVMLMSVRDRRREIGLRRAVGARRGDIRLQFVAESSMLGIAGGLTGVITGIAGARAAAMLGRWDLVISWEAALLALAGSAVLGLVIGVLPAGHAAKLEPVAALRAT